MDRIKVEPDSHEESSLATCSEGSFVSIKEEYIPEELFSSQDPQNTHFKSTVQCKKEEKQEVEEEKEEGILAEEHEILINHINLLSKEPATDVDLADDRSEEEESQPSPWRVCGSDGQTITEDSGHILDDREDSYRCERDRLPPDTGRIDDGEALGKCEGLPLEFEFVGVAEVEAREERRCMQQHGTKTFIIEKEGKKENEEGKADVLQCNDSKHFKSLIKVRNSTELIDERHLQVSNISNTYQNEYSSTPLTQETAKQSVRRRECKPCNMSFDHCRDLVKHNTQVHSLDGATEARHQCKECNKSFARVYDLGRHVSEVHPYNRERNYACHICNKSFTRVYHLRRHVKLHTYSEPHVCEVCNKVFASAGSLKVHSVTHSGEKPFTCIVCNKSFWQKGGLETHIRVHSGHKPFACGVCNHSFTDVQTLNAHSRCHTGEKPFTCDVCKQSFTRKYHLLCHVKRRHGGKKSQVDGIKSEA